MILHYYKKNDKYTSIISAAIQENNNKTSIYPFLCVKKYNINTIKSGMPPYVSANFLKSIYNIEYFKSKKNNLTNFFQKLDNFFLKNLKSVSPPPPKK